MTISSICTIFCVAIYWLAGPKKIDYRYHWRKIACLRQYTIHGAGREHPAQVLEQYRQKINPNDPLSFGIAGFDAAVPQLITEFIQGKV